MTSVKPSNASVPLFDSPSTASSTNKLELNKFDSTVITNIAKMAGSIVGLNALTKYHNQCLKHLSKIANEVNAAIHEMDFSNGVDPEYLAQQCRKINVLMKNDKEKLFDKILLKLKIEIDKFNNRIIEFDFNKFKEIWCHAFSMPDEYHPELIEQFLVPLDRKMIEAVSLDEQARTTLRNQLNELITTRPTDKRFRLLMFKIQHIERQANNVVSNRIEFDEVFEQIHVLPPNEQPNVLGCLAERLSGLSIDDVRDRYYRILEEIILLLSRQQNVIDKLILQIAKMPDPLDAYRALKTSLMSPLTDLVLPIEKCMTLLSRDFVIQTNRDAFALLAELKAEIFNDQSQKIQGSKLENKICLLRTLCPNLCFLNSKDCKASWTHLLSEVKTLPKSVQLEAGSGLIEYLHDLDPTYIYDNFCNLIEWVQTLPISLENAEIEDLPQLLTPKTSKSLTSQTAPRKEAIEILKKKLKDLSYSDIFRSSLLDEGKECDIESKIDQLEI